MTRQKVGGKRLPAYLQMASANLARALASGPCLDGKSPFAFKSDRPSGAKPIVERRRTGSGCVVATGPHHPVLDGMFPARTGPIETATELRQALGHLMARDDLQITGLAVTLGVNAHSLGLLMRGQYVGKPRTMLQAFKRYQERTQGRCRACGQPTSQTQAAAV